MPPGQARPEAQFYQSNIKFDVIHLGVEPEVDPGHDDQHAAGHVDGDEVVRELALEHEVHREAAVLPGVGLHVAVAARVALDTEPGQVEAPGQLDRIVVPEVGDVIRSVSV